MICLLFMAIALTGSASPLEAPPRTPQNRIEVDPNNISPQAARRLIEAFLLDPAGANGRAAMPLVLRFAAQSEAVDVQVVPEVVSWLGEGEDERLRILHGARYSAFTGRFAPRTRPLPPRALRPSCGGTATARSCNTLSSARKPPRTELPVDGAI